VQLGEPYSSASGWWVEPERPGRKDSYRVGNPAGDRRLSSGRCRRDRLGGRRDIHEGFPKGIRNGPCDAYLLADQGDTVSKANADANRHAPRNARSLEKHEAGARQARAGEAEVGGDEAETEADEADGDEAKAKAETHQTDAREAEAQVCEAEARQAETEAREAEGRQAEAQGREAEAEGREAEGQGNTGTRPGVVEPPGSHADRDAETEPHGDSGAHAHGNANSDAKHGSDA